jgi:PAS domain S-box-containing protein
VTSKSSDERNGTLPAPDSAPSPVPSASAGRVHASEEQFRLLVESVKDYAIFMLTPEGRIASWNAGARNIKGYTAEEIIGRHFSIFYPADAAARGWPDHELRMAVAAGRFEDEAYRVRKDGTRFWANVVITPVYDASGVLRGFAKVTRDLTVRRQFEALQRGERRMIEFLAMLGHELRNPLAPLQAALDVLELRPGDAATIEWSRKVFGRQVQHLTRLVDDLLDAGRISSGKVSLHFGVVDLRTLVEETVEAMRPQIEAQGHTLALVLPADAIRVRGDATRIAQIITNLLTNASKYTPDGGDIRVVVATDGDFVMLEVHDTGMGMPPELIPSMFELFVQGGRELNRSQGGLGVGLTLVKRLTELHGGTVAATSAGPGKGSDFVVRLPRLADHAVLPEAFALRSVKVPSFKVLVVEDNEDVRQALVMLLSILGHQVRMLGDGAQVLQSASQFTPDLILLDIGLPHMNGLDIARALRAEAQFRNVMLVACTGYGQEDDQREAREAGFDQHLIKPVQAIDLERVLSELAGRKAASDARGGSQPGEAT